MADFSQINHPTVKTLKYLSLMALMDLSLNADFFTKPLPVTLTKPSNALQSF